MNHLFNVSLWGDEAFSAVAAQKAFLPMTQVVLKDTSPPLMYFVMFLWFRIFGSSEIAIRSLSFIFYLGTVMVVYLIGKKLFDKKTAVLSVLLTFFNPFLFPYAFEGRMYFCLLFFVTLSFYFLITQNSLGYILSAAAALYSHHFGILAIIPQFIWQATQIKKISPEEIWKLLQPYLLIGLIYLPWVYPLYRQTKLVASGFWLGKPKIKDLPTTFVHFLANNLKLKTQLVISGLAGTVLITGKRQNKELKKEWLLIAWAVLPLLLAFVISQTKVSIFYERYLLYSIPPIMLLLASRSRGFILILTAIIFSFYLTSCWQQFTNPYKKPFREFANWVKTNVPNDTFLVNYNGAAHHLWESKYYGLEAPIYASSEELPFFVGTAQMTNEDLVSQLPKDRLTGLISSDPPNSVKIEGYRIIGYHQLGPFYFIYLTANENG